MGQVDAGEQVGDDPVEEGDVVGEELGQVHVNDGAQQLQAEPRIVGYNGGNE